MVFTCASVRVSVLMLMCHDICKILNMTQFGIAPWFADGSINPKGVAYGRLEDLVICKELQVENFEQKSWTCKLCHAVVHKRPSASSHVEPVWWWWCEACRQKNKCVSGGKKRTKFNPADDNVVRKQAKQSCCQSFLQQYFEHK